jgi:hypothetical protein
MTHKLSLEDGARGYEMFKHKQGRESCMLVLRGVY